MTQHSGHLAARVALPLALPESAAATARDNYLPVRSPQIKVLHLITNVGHGGAQKVLADIVNAGDERFEHHVVSLVAGEPFFETNAKSLVSLGLKRGQMSPWAIPKLRRIARTVRPDLVHAWLYHGNLASIFLRDLVPRIVWAIHNTTLDRQHTKLTTRATNRLCSVLSRWAPDRIIYVSTKARALHEALGYRRDKSILIENGIELSGYESGPEARLNARRSLEIADDDVVVGCIARYDPQKDHQTIIAAFAHALRREPRLRLVLVGLGCTPANAELAALLREAGVAEHAMLLGERRDIALIISALDLLLIGSAFGEALPLVALEGAAIGVPIVATKVGDLGPFVLESRALVPPRQPNAMAGAILHALERKPGDDRRRYVLEERYSLTAMLEKYGSVYSGDAPQ
jgi:glycosyltransferase involved in cell wall biosynthesis